MNLSNYKFKTKYHTLQCNTHWFINWSVHAHRLKMNCAHAHLMCAHAQLEYACFLFEYSCSLCMHEPQEPFLECSVTWQSLTNIFFYYKKKQIRQNLANMLFWTIFNINIFWNFAKLGIKKNKILTEQQENHNNKN